MLIFKLYLHVKTTVKYSSFTYQNKLSFKNNPDLK